MGSIQARIRTTMRENRDRLNLFLKNKMLHTMALRRTRDIKNQIRLSLEPVHREPDISKAYFEIKDFYESILLTWASGKSELLNSFFASQFIRYRVIKFAFFSVTQGVILTQVYIFFNFRKAVSLIALPITMVLILLIEFFKYFPENSLRINYPSYTDAEGGYWVKESSKQKFQKKYFFLLNANDISHSHFTEELENSLLNPDEKSIAMQLKSDGFLGTIDELLTSSKLLAK